MAEYRSFASLGPIALLLEHSANPAGVIAAMVEFRHLLCDVFRLDTEEFDDVGVIRCLMPHGKPSLQVSSIIVALAYRALSHSSGGRWRPDCIHFMHDKPQRIATFERYFQTPLEFNSNFDGFSCPKQALLVANPLADEQMADHARTLLRLLRSPVAPKSILDLAMQAISLLIGSRQPTLAAVASNLGFSTRTLQRALKREGRSFASLLDETRRQLAVRYLAASSTPIYLIAEMVGYADSSSFSRWFTREFGETPLTFRLRHRALQQDVDF
jgi:AraC-like DNA-binding protein